MNTKTPKKGFETYRLKLNMRSQNYYTVHLNRITAPEFLIMQSIHGRGSLEMLEPQGIDIERRLTETGTWMQRARPAEALLEKLISKYTAEVVKKVFPGENPVLPFTYADAGIDKDNMVEGEGIGDGWEEIDAVIVDETDKTASAAPVAPSKPKAKEIDLIGAKTEKA